MFVRFTAIYTELYVMQIKYVLGMFTCNEMFRNSTWINPPELCVLGSFVPKL